jgi:hypothetical protein
MRIGSLPCFMLLGRKARHAKIGGWGQKWGQNAFGAKSPASFFTPYLERR